MALFPLPHRRRHNTFLAPSLSDAQDDDEAHERFRLGDDGLVGKVEFHDCAASAAYAMRRETQAAMAVVVVRLIVFM